jgi:lichenan operon transcriptional antiterminator
MRRKNEVHLIMLMHIGKNNPQAFQLWDYFSKIFADKSLVERLVADPSYDNFIHLMTEALETGINNSEGI